MSRHNRVIWQIGFWGVLILALTAENWMDLVCRVLFQV